MDLIARFRNGQSREICILIEAVRLRIGRFSCVAFIPNFNRVTFLVGVPSMI